MSGIIRIYLVNVVCRDRNGGSACGEGSYLRCSPLKRVVGVFYLSADAAEPGGKGQLFECAVAVVIERIAVCQLGVC